MPRTTVALLVGGRSSEHEISCATAGGVLAAIDRERFEIVPIGITAAGAFTLQPDDAAAFRLDPAAMPVVHDNGTRVLWPESASSRQLRVTDAAGTTTALAEVDIVFPLLHGPFGEDGTVQGMLELIGLPYVGNGVLASALAMNKHVTKTVLRAAGIAVAPWVAVAVAQWREEGAGWRAQVADLGLPLFVKPARAGSSVGVNRIESLEDLDAALEIAFAEDDTALVEQAMVGREIECGVLSGRGSEKARVSVAGEIVMVGRDFYDYVAKYVDPDAARLVCPASLTQAESAEVRSIAARTFDAIGGQGLARVDFFLTEAGFVVNELNTMPGFTPISMFPKCWEASGLDYVDLITELIELGMDTVR